MTNLCCPQCRLRFGAAASAYLTTCSGCGRPLQPTALAESLGFRLVGPQDLPAGLPEAIAVSIPVPDPGRRPPTLG